MAYIKYKEISKYFNFSKAITIEKTPDYVLDYIFEDEDILSIYKTRTDHGIFTDKKMVLFDLGSTFGIAKMVYTIPYKSISSLCVTYKRSSASLSMMLDSGYPLVLKFVNMSGLDKVRLRLLYSIMSQVMNNQTVNQEYIRQLKENDIHFKK